MSDESVVVDENTVERVAEALIRAAETVHIEGDGDDPVTVEGSVNDFARAAINAIGHTEGETDE